MQKGLIKYISWILLLLFVILTLGFWWFIDQHIADKEKIWYQLIVTLLTNSIASVIIAFFVKLFLKKYEEEELQNQILRTIQGGKELLNNFGNDEKKNFIKNNVISIVGDEKNGVMIFDNIVEGYLKKPSYRDNLCYEVKFKSLNFTNKNDYDIIEDDFYETTQLLRYEKYMVETTQKEFEFKIFFSLGDQKLLNSFDSSKNDDIFFRETLYFKEETVLKIKEKTKEFVENVLKFNLEFGREMSILKLLQKIF
jgi:hypothetical protein